MCLCLFFHWYNSDNPRTTLSKHQQPLSTAQRQRHLLPLSPPSANSTSSQWQDLVHHCLKTVSRIKKAQALMARSFPVPPTEVSTETIVLRYARPTCVASTGSTGNTQAASLKPTRPGERSGGMILRATGSARILLQTGARTLGQARAIQGLVQGRTSRSTATSGTQGHVLPRVKR